MSRYSSRDSDRDRRPDLDTKIYVGDLPRDANERDLERAFSYYGPLRNVWVARNPAGFAFVEFEDPRDADDAVRALDGTNLCGTRIRVEHSTGKVRPKPWLRGGRGPPPSSSRSGGGGGGGGGGRRPFDPADRCYECGGRGHYAYDCSRYRGRDRDRRSSYSRRSRSRSYSRSRSRSGSRGKARSYSRSRSRSPARSKSRSRSP